MLFTISMNNLKDKIGFDAGCVWKVLDSQGVKSIKELKKTAKLTERELYAAIGWLSREEKLTFQQVENELLVSLA